MACAELAAMLGGAPLATKARVQRSMAQRLPWPLVATRHSSPQRASAVMDGSRGIRHSHFYCGPLRRENVRPNQLQVITPRHGDAVPFPLADRLRSNATHPPHFDGSA